MFTGIILLLVTFQMVLVLDRNEKESLKIKNEIHEKRLPDNITKEDNLRILNELIETEEYENSITSTAFYENEFTASTEMSMKTYNVILERCPPGLTYREHLTLPFCYTLTEKQTFPPRCPYENYLEYDAITAIFKQFENVTIWVRAKRDSENALGEFEWLDPSIRYLDLIKGYENPGSNISQKKCMIRKDDSLIPTLCTEKYPALCVYSYSKAAIEKFCSKRNYFYRCISTSLNLDNKCYCQGLVEGMKPPREAFCSKLAEPREPFQSTLILTQLTNRSPCWFGMNRNENGVLHWISTNETVNYSYLKEEADASKSQVAFDFNKPKGWILEEDTALTCAICEVEVDYRQVKIQLKHIPREDKIEIRIQNVVDIHNYFLVSYVLACFTDSNTNGLKQKIISGITDIFSVNQQNYTKSVKIQNFYPSYYWCETIQRPNLLRIQSNKILAYKEEGKHHHEYALVIQLFVPNDMDPYLQQLHVKLSNFLYTKLQETTSIINVVRPMKVLNFSEIEQYMDILLHLSTKFSELSSHEEYDILYKFLESLPEAIVEDNDVTIRKLIQFSRSEICVESETVSGTLILHWPETAVGITVLPKEICLQKNSTPVVRTCLGDFLMGAFWSEVQGECEDVPISERTVALYELLNTEVTAGDELSEELVKITNDKEDILTVEVHLVAQILNKLSTNLQNVDIEKIMQIISNMMEFNREILKDAQILLNSTDKTLNELDVILNTKKINSRSDHISYKSNKLLIQVSDLQTSNITGMTVHRIKIDDENDTLITKPLYHVSLEELLNQEMDAAVFLPERHIEEIQKCMEHEETPIKLILSLFYDDMLFNEVKEREEQCNSRVVSVLVPGFDCEFKTPIIMVFKPFKGAEKLDCGHWKYGANDAMVNFQGSWQTDNLATNVIPNKNNYILCQYSHTTHFALLMLDEKNKDSISPASDLALNIITAIGCGLSLIGLCGIFITAILFKSWRNCTRNAIMLHFSVSLAAQMILLFISDNAREDSFLCLISGASLHYTVLAEFAWMLIVAILQYRKFVMVFQKPIPHLMIKCIIVGWCLPMIPVAVFIGIFPKGYQQNSMGLCYPEHQYFYYGVIMPVCLIVLINLFVFINILWNICCRKVVAYGHKDNEVKLQVLLAILLFFLLGMSWIFGIIASFTGYLLMSYLFCLTATLQGFVIFLFFVVMNKKCRLLWLNVQRYCFCMDTKTGFY